MKLYHVKKHYIDYLSKIDPHIIISDASPNTSGFKPILKPKKVKITRSKNRIK